MKHMMSSTELNWHIHYIQTRIEESNVYPVYQPDHPEGKRIFFSSDCTDLDQHHLQPTIRHFIQELAYFHRLGLFYEQYEKAIMLADAGVKDFMSYFIPIWDVMYA